MNRRDALLATTGLAALVASGPAAAAHASMHVTASGIEVYYGFLPAAMVRGHPQDHGGKPADPSAWHLVVALFDSATGTRIAEAKVSARVGPLGGAEETKALEPMQVAGTVTFGQYFAMPGRGAYRISLMIKRPGTTVPVVVGIEHRHP